MQNRTTPSIACFIALLLVACPKQTPQKNSTTPPIETSQTPKPAAESQHPKSKEDSYVSSPQNSDQTDDESPQYPTSPPKATDLVKDPKAIQFETDVRNMIKGYDLAKFRPFLLDTQKCPDNSSAGLRSEYEQRRALKQLINCMKSGFSDEKHLWTQWVERKETPKPFRTCEAYKKVGNLQMMYAFADGTYRYLYIDDVVVDKDGSYKIGDNIWCRQVIYPPASWIKKAEDYVSSLCECADAECFKSRLQKPGPLGDLVMRSLQKGYNNDQALLLHERFMDCRKRIGE